MKRRIVVACVLGSAACLWAQNVQAQKAARMSDVSGANLSLISRGVVRAFGAPPAPPPVLIVNPALLDALCLERVDAVFAYATMSQTAETAPERTALALLRSGPVANDAAASMSAALLKAGADSTHVQQLIAATKGLLAQDHPQVIPVAAAVTSYNDLVKAAPADFLAAPPAEFTALRAVLGRLTGSANQVVAAERVYPGLKTAGMRYANDAQWVLSGQPIQAGETSYSQYGQVTLIGDRTFRHIGDYEGVWVLAEEPVPETLSIVYVPLRKYCDVELLPYVAEQKIIKGLRSSLWP